MNKMKYTGPILGVILIFGLVWFMGCATTGSSTQGETQVDDVADIDELLGLTDTKADEGQDEGAISEDDVLKLLGGVEEGEPDISPPEEEKTADSKSSLEQQVDQLEAEKSTLDKKEQDLKEKVAEQENIIADLQKQPVRDVEPVRGEATSTRGVSSFNGRYQEALQSYRSRQYRNAIQKFEMLLGMDSKHTLSDNCQYWIGECYYGLGQYQQAIVAFQKVFSFVNTNKNADAQLKLGLCYMQLKDYEKAKGEFQKLIDSYPTSEFVTNAKRYMAQIE